MGGIAVVVGGGVGGLTTAIGLRRIGWEVTVLERAPVLADVGGGISLHANGIRALDALGIGPAIRAAIRPQYTGGTRTSAGRWLARLDGAELERRLGAPVAGIRRAELLRVLCSALPKDRVMVGAEVESVDRSDPARVRVLLGDGGTLDADLIVAADGVNSRLRAGLFPGHPGPAYSGTTVLRATTPGPIALDSDLELTWGRGAEFGHLTFADGRVEWHAVLNSPPGVRHPDPLAFLRARCDGWHDTVTTLLGATEPDAVLHHDIHELTDPLPAFTADRIALLGDAAHAMTPNLGQGASQALEDAAALAAALASEPTLTSALTRYDAERRPRSQSVARAARLAGRMGQQLTNPVAVTLRNTALRMAPSGATLRAFLRHAAWTPPVLA
ncbi:FAD-dependent monooxygenase [Streptomyces sp. HUAS ZL42]|uniref:FAD-dependent monooxygenase n=1 Tax=Streptomyces sp. HUAS ZL42 TaxID=3231715 RepID=UPI00345ED742